MAKDVLGPPEEREPQLAKPDERRFLRRHLGKCTLILVLGAAAAFALSSPGSLGKAPNSVPPASASSADWPAVRSTESLSSQRLGTSAVPTAQTQNSDSAAAEPKPEPDRSSKPKVAQKPKPSQKPKPNHYQPRYALDSSGFLWINEQVEPWPKMASLERIANSWQQAGLREIDKLNASIGSGSLSQNEIIRLSIYKAACWNFERKPTEAYRELESLRARVESDPVLAEQWLYTVMFFQGICAMRRGEDENCILCRGESSCIIPISKAAVHTNQEGSRLAIRHFEEYLQRFPDDLEARWLLNVAYMTLGEYPAKVPTEFLVALESWTKPEFDIGVFRDVGHLTKLNRLNMAGGSILEDFDNDGHLDVVVTALFPTEPMAFYRNNGTGTFDDHSEQAGVLQQLGGLNCVQTDYNNDGWMDIYIPRGAWLADPMRPSLLRNDGEGRFTDVTSEAGLLDPVNSISAKWADYDNDGWLDLFVCCERQENRLYHNLGNGKFESVAEKMGVQGAADYICKGVAWIDYDNDDYPDLFLNHFSPEGAHLFHNDQGKSFTDVSQSVGIDGPLYGFSCWAFDYDNDGWLDLFATSYNAPLHDVVEGLMGKSPNRDSNKLFRNVKGERFEDMTKQSGLEKFYGTMGSNFGDFDNDGFPDMYLGTGDPHLSTLVPNRMFKNVGGERFAEITASARTGNLQKGHGVSCGDWDHDGDVDIFIQMGGAVPGDSYHNILFQNPGQGNHWLTIKLVGQKTNRAAIGARIKAVTDSDPPLVVHQQISSGSSFGGSPLLAHVGMRSATRLASLEIHWPTSGTTQVFQNVPADQNIVVTEFATEYQTRALQPIALPAE